MELGRGGGGKLGGGSGKPCLPGGLGNGGCTGHWLRAPAVWDGAGGGYCMKLEWGGMYPLLLWKDEPGGP